MVLTWPTTKLSKALKSMRKHVVCIIILQSTGLPLSFFAARNTFPALNATKRKAAASMKFGPKTSSMKRRYYAEHAGTNCRSKTIWPALQPALPVHLYSTRGAACINISTLNKDLQGAAFFSYKIKGVGAFLLSLLFIQV